LAIANSPASYNVTVIPDAPFLVLPEVSSERRDYIPIGWLEPPVLPSNKLRLLLNATLWHFGILTSRMHMAWTIHIGGRLKSDYQYGIGLNYNTFPWPGATASQRIRVEALAQAVLDARRLPKNATSSLADLYHRDTMPAELRKAHRELDLAVDHLYRTRPFLSDRDRVEHLFPLYEALVHPTTAAPRANRRTSRRIARRHDLQSAVAGHSVASDAELEQAEEVALSASNPADYLIGAAEAHVASMGRHLGEGADHGLRELVRTGIDRLLRDHGGVEPDRLLQARNDLIELLDKAEEIAGDLDDYASDLLGERSFFPALSWFCPRYPFC
jgi:hypothetical protein